MAELPELFDAHLHPAALTDPDLESLRFFGVTAAVVPADHAPRPPTAKALLAHFDDLVQNQLPRLRRAGIHAYAALGVHPSAVPRRGLHEVLSGLPGYFGGGQVVALGELGLHAGGGTEEDAFLEQLSLAKRLKLPVLVHTPAADKERITRRTLSLLRDSAIAPAQVLVDHASGRTVRLILECGHYAGLTLHPDELRAERALALIRKHGSERLVIDSGDGAGDLLGLPRLASLLARAELSDRIIANVLRNNALRFYRVSG